jgi:hypothetical protein
MVQLGIRLGHHKTERRASLPTHPAARISLNSVSGSSTSCNHANHDCICGENDTYLQETAQCIAIWWGADEFTATASLALQNCGLTGDGEVLPRATLYSWACRRYPHWYGVSVYCFNLVCKMGYNLTDFFCAGAASQTATIIPVSSTYERGGCNNNPCTGKHWRLFQFELKLELELQ